MPELTSDDGKKGNLLSQSACLYVASYVAIFFKFLGGFLAAGILGPTLYGLRTFFGLIVEYEYFSHSGTFNAMDKEVPYHRGRNDLQKADQVANNVFAANLLYAVIVGTILFLAAIYLSQTSHEQIYVDFVLFLSVHIFFNKIQLFYEVRLVVDKRSYLLSATRVLYQATSAIFSVGFAFLCGLRGLLVGLLIADIITVTFLLYRVKKVPAIRISPTITWQLIKIGLPIMLIGMGFLLLVSIDRMIILAMLSREMLGYFGIATIISGVIYMTLADMIRVIVFPRLMEKIGAHQNISQLKNCLLEPTLLVSYFIPFLIGVLFLSIHLPLKYFLPAYLPALTVSKILVLGSFFISILITVLLVCVAMNKERPLLYLTVGAVVLNAIFSYSLISLGLGIDGVAAGTAVAYFVFSVAVFGYALKQFGVARQERFRFFVVLYAPIVYASLLVFLLDLAAFFEVDGLVSDLWSTAAKVFIFVPIFALILIPMRNQRAFIRLVDSIPVFHRWIQAQVR